MPRSVYTFIRRRISTAGRTKESPCGYPTDPKSDITKGCILERPKVIYNRKTAKFVMWFHLETEG